MAALNGVEGVNGHGHFDRQWLTSSCASFASRRSGLAASELEEQVIALLASDNQGESACVPRSGLQLTNKQDDELQMALADIVGYDDLDLVIDIISHRKAILTAPRSKPVTSNGVSGPRQSERRHGEKPTGQPNGDAESLFTPSSRSEPHYPHVYKTHSAGNLLAPGGRRYALPPGSERKEHKAYEEYSIPPSRVGVLGGERALVKIAKMDDLCKKTFKGYDTLNRMQSLVYPVAYETNENMLICAPTGAGKTDAAMLTILHCIGHNVTPSPTADPTASKFQVDVDNFKIIYVAPMKALAAEVTEKLGKRLAWLGIKVRELTGDMHLTRKEISETQIIVTTPEKWDVVTRKSTGDTELVQKVRLLIIDEVHMLHDERGAVLESLVARTQRQVESTQSMIRIVGLSATLPNYVDVAEFLKVNLYAGLFYFNQSFRPVPLEQHFIGVKGKPNSKASRDNLDNTTFEKIKEMLEEGHQVMVFVHSRKDTVNTARKIRNMAQEQGCLDLLDCSTVDGFELAMKELRMAKGKEVKELVPTGFGIHHAGMPRTDRNRIEQLFSQGHIGVLCCTATLAWGVNLPAAAVIIKGTQIYSADAGKFVDIGILDVLQIFGRAGRPQFQSTGIGFICTTHDKLHHYLSAVTQQQPIESKFSSKLVDNLNAEISLGTVTSVPEAVQWIGYSYMFVRMRRSPMIYGIDWTEIRDDPHLVGRRRKLVIEAARVLQKSQMIIFNERTEELKAKDVGRIASQFYVLQSTIDIFNEMMQPQASEADVLKMISLSGEFDNIQSRDNEYAELTYLGGKDISPCDVPGKPDQASTKTNILLQAYISRARIEDFALTSDCHYVAQNSARICRALFMIALNRRWGTQCQVLLSLCKSIEKQVWSFQHPFHQFELPVPILRNLQSKLPASSVESLRDMDSAEIGELVHNHGMGKKLSGMLRSFPTLGVEVEIAPLNRDVLRIHLFLFPHFTWNEGMNGAAESYWIWVENSDTAEIYHHEYFILSRKKRFIAHEMNFTIPLSDPLPTQIYICALSDRWLGAETITPVSFQHLIRPDIESVYTDLLNLQPLPVSVLNNPALEELYGRRFEFFNPMQTQLFHTMYHRPDNVLLGSPTGSGKTIAAELAMWWAFREKPGSKVVYIAPMKALVRERVQDWRKRLAQPMGMKLVELTGDNTPDTRSIRDADVIITTPEKWDGISRSWQTRDYVRKVSLVIIDEIHLLGGDRGPILEIIVSRMNYIASQSKGAVRLVGMSTACANATDLANWLGVKHGLFNFRHSVRPVPLEIFIDGFPEQRGFCPLMQSMNRPTFMAIKNHSPDKPVIVFVASRRQTRLTAKDLINYCGMEDDPRRFVRMSEDDLELNLARVKDEALREALSFGIGLHHAGLVESDRQLAEELFANNKIQILVATSTLAWGVNLPAHLVVVKGTQFYDAKIEGYKDMDLTDVLQMLGRAGRPQFDTSGIARIFTQDAKKDFYKHFLHTGFPVESSLHNVLDNHLGAEASAGTILTKQDALDYLTWTFFFRRLHKNPSYYGLEISSEDHNTIEAQRLANDYMVTLVDKSLEALAESQCITLHSNGDVDSTSFGRIMSYYYLSHRTIRHIVQHAKSDAGFEDVLSWLCSAAEFDKLPVRHNEDLINAELAQSLPLDVSIMGQLPMWDPHVKAFLLLQAHFSRSELPISDYVGDQISVLDQSIRVIQATIDVLAELGHYRAVKSAIWLLTSVKSAWGPSDDPSSILPGVSVKPLLAQPQRPAEILMMRAADAARILEISKSERADFDAAYARLPRIDYDASRVTAAEVAVTLTRNAVGNGNGRDVRVYAPRFPKAQTEGWFVMLTTKDEQLVALKRVGWAAARAGEGTRTGAGGSRLSVTTTMKMPVDANNDASRIMDVQIVSDTYLQMHFVRSNIEIPAAPRVQDDGKKGAS